MSSLDYDRKYIDFTKYKCASLLPEEKLFLCFSAIIIVRDALQISESIETIFWNWKLCLLFLIFEYDIFLTVRKCYKVVNYVASMYK